MLKKYIVDLMQDNPLNGISTYNDVLTLSTGVISRKIKKMVLTGEENWGATTGGYYLADLPENYLRGQGINYALCSHNPTYPQVQTMAGVPERYVSFSYDTLPRLYFKTSDIASLSDFKIYLQQQYSAETPVTVWYVLANETTGHITVPTGLSGTVDGYTIQTGAPTPTNPIYPTANTVTMWANYTPSRYNGIAFVTATGQPEQYNGGWT